MKKTILGIIVLYLGINSTLYADELEDRIQECEQGSGVQCELLAVDYEMGFDVEKNEVKGFYFHKKSCDTRFARGCQGTAQCYEKGIGTGKNINKAIKYYKLACDYKQPYSSIKVCEKYEELQKEKK